MKELTKIRYTIVAIKLTIWIALSVCLALCFLAMLRVVVTSKPEKHPNNIAFFLPSIGYRNSQRLLPAL